MGVAVSPEQAIQFDVETLRQGRIRTAAISEQLKLERAAIHQVGDAEAKLIELEIDVRAHSGLASVTDKRHTDLLRQKLDGTKRLAASQIQRKTLELAANDSQLAVIDEMLKAISAPLYNPAGGKLTQ